MHSFECAGQEEAYAFYLARFPAKAGTQFIIKLGPCLRRGTIRKKYGHIRYKCGYNTAGCGTHPDPMRGKFGMKNKGKSGPCATAYIGLFSGLISKPTHQTGVKK